MEAKELMIGDKVAVRSNDGCDLHVMTVSEVKSEGISSGNHFVFFAYDEIEPIPITTEILEKNGFDSQGNSSYRYFKSYDDSYYTGFESAWYYFERKELKVTKEHRNGIQECVNKFNVRYVHELRHALLGLNEVADNLKI